MLIIPAEHPLDWKRPPVITLLLILLNTLIYFAYQGKDPAREEQAVRTRQFLGYREVIDYYGGTTQVPIEEWSYGPRNGMYYYLRFEANRLIKVESKRGQ